MSLVDMHKAWVLVLFLSLRAFAQDGGVPDAGPTPFADAMYNVCPEAPPVMTLGEAMQSDAGYDWLVMHPLRSSRIGCLMATCESDRLSKKETLAGPPPFWWVALTGGAVSVAFGAFMAGRLTAPPSPPKP